MLFLFVGIIIGTGAIIYVTKGRKETIERMRKEREEEEQRMKEEEDRLRLAAEQVKAQPPEIDDRLLSGDQKLVQEFQARLKDDPQLQERYAKFLQDKRDSFLKSLPESQRKQVDEYFTKKATEYADKLKKAREEGKSMPDEEGSSFPIFEYLITFCLFAFIYQIVASYMGWTTTMDVIEAIRDAVVEVGGAFIDFLRPPRGPHMPIDQQPIVAEEPLNREL